MTWVEIELHWARFTKLAQTKWPKLTDDDLVIVDGNRDRLIGKLEKRYGLARIDGEQHVDEWSSHEANGAPPPP